MNIETIKTIVAEWLEEKTLPELLPRDLRFLDLDQQSEIIAIIGPRRSGKTFYMYQLMKELLDGGKHERDEILFIDFEDYRLADFSGRNVEDLFVVFKQLTGKIPAYLFFDEVQHLTGWSRILRTLHNRNQHKIVVSGSSSELSTQEISTELRGRYRDILMLPFSLKEILKFKNISYSEMTFYTSSRGNILGALDAYLEAGGFPEVVKTDDMSDKKELLRNYYRTAFYKDIVERYGIKAKHLLESLMSYCLNTYAELFSISSFVKHLKSNDVPGSKETISNYLNYLENVFFLITHQKFSFSPRKRIMNPKKVYLLDPGFCLISTGFSPNKGKILENAVAIELFRRSEEVFYFKGRHECDFIVKRGNRPEYAMQVCWELNQSNRDREFRGLAEAMKEFQLSKGYVLTYDQEETVEYKGHHAVVEPVWKWLLKDDHGNGEI